MSIGIDAVERFLFVLAGDSTEPGAGRVDKDEIARVEQALIVVGDRVGRRRRMGVVGGDDPFRAKRPHVQPHGR
jgi:hypothetical protein